LWRWTKKFKITTLPSTITIFVLGGLSTCNKNSENKKIEKITGEYLNFRETKHLKTKSKLDLCMDEEFRVRGKIASKVKDFCMQKGKEGSECLELLYELAVKKSSANSNVSLKRIYNKYEGAKCIKCKRDIALGELCYYDPDAHNVICANCFVKANAGVGVTKELVDAEIKLARMKEEIKYYEQQKKELLNELKIVQIYEELNNIVKEFDQKKEELKKVINDYGFSQNENERKKVYEKIDEIKELIKTQNEKIEMLAKSLLRAKKAKSS